MQWRVIGHALRDLVIFFETVYVNFRKGVTPQLFVFLERTYPLLIFNSLYNVAENLRDFELQ